jgi:hypothetical protein
VTGKPPHPGEAATAADRTNQRQRHGDARWTRTSAGQLLALDAAAIVASLIVALLVGCDDEDGDRLARDLDQTLTGASHG